MTKRKRYYPWSNPNVIAVNLSQPWYAYRNKDNPAGTKIAKKAAKSKLGLGKPQ